MTYNSELTVVLPKEYKKLAFKTIPLSKAVGLGQHYDRRLNNPNQKIFGMKNLHLCFRESNISVLNNDIIYHKPHMFGGSIYTFYGFDNEWNFKVISIPTPKNERNIYSDQLLDIFTNIQLS